VAPSRCKRLPAENMWTSDDFAGFLESRAGSSAAEGAWERTIYPGMKDAIIGMKKRQLSTQLHSFSAEAMVASQPLMDVKMRQKAFELFGADFMVAQDFRLICKLFTIFLSAFLPLL